MEAEKVTVWNEIFGEGQQASSTPGWKFWGTAKSQWGPEKTNTN